MNISITGRHLDVTPSLKDYIQKKVEKVKYYFDHIINVHVILEVNKLTHLAEVTILSDEKTFFCEVSSADMYESIDKLFDKTERQIRRNKEKFHQKRKSTGNAVQDVNNTILSEVKVKDDNHNEEIVISKVKEVAPKPMTELEAILQLSMNNHSFEIFNEEKNGVMESIALKDNENHFSLIQKNNHHWTKRNLKLNENQELIELSKCDFNIETYTISQAVNMLMAKEQEGQYIIFFDPEINSINVLYYRKNHTLGLLTSGGNL